MTAVAQLEGSVRPRSAPRFVHGGIAFDFLCGPGVDFHVTAEHERFSAPFSAGPVAASIRVAVAALRYDVPTGREIDGRWADGLATLRSRGVRAEMREIGRGRFVASALVEPGPIGCTALATALAGAALERVGGLILHASAVEVDDGAVLFVGPSTAGKTTAANLCRGARAFAKDRAAIYPTANGWYAAPMWGGASEIELPWSARRVLPLHAILRIAKDDTPAVHDAGPARAVGILRESAQVIRHGALEEGALLEQLVRMSSEVRVGVARTVLGQPMLPVLREWLEAGGMIAPDSRLTRSSRVASRVVGDRAVVVLIDTRELHTLNEVGTFVWEAFGSSRAVADVVADVAREFEVTPETAEGDVLRFIVRMMALGALQLVEEAP